MLESKNACWGKHKRTLASVYHLFDGEEKSSLLSCPGEPNEAGPPLIFTDIEGRDVFISSLCGHAKVSGLVRSQSFPPEGWYKTTSKYLLRIRKAWNSQDCYRRFKNSDNEIEDLCRRKTIVEPTAASSGHTSPMAVNSACATSSVPEQVFGPSRALESPVSLSLAGPSTARLSPSGGDAAALSGGGDAPAMTTREKATDVGNGTTLSTFDMVDMPHTIPCKPPIVEKSASDQPLGPESVTPLSGKLLVCGRRREMEDMAAIIPSFLGRGRDGPQSGKQTNPDWHFYGVYDGHGGSQASAYCMERLHQIVAEELMLANALLVPEGGAAVDSSNIEWERIMKTAFLKMDKEVGGVCPNKANSEDDDGYDGGCLCCEDAVAPENVGTTAVVAIVGLQQVVVANCGDSRAVLARGSQAIPLSRDHKPELEDETRRIEAAGGRIIAWDGYRVGGLLALSRAMGDRYLKRYVISEPEIVCIQRSEDDECLILASDGLWDVVTSEFACEVARKSLPALRRKYASRSCAPGEDAASAALAALLVKLAYGRNSKDNITVVVVDLKSRARRQQR